MANPINPPGIVKSDSAELDQLAFEINADHELAARSFKTGLETARKVGLKLLKAKSKVGHTKWIAWLTKHVRFGARQAQYYMREARGTDEIKYEVVTSYLKSYSEDVTEEDEIPSDTESTPWRDDSADAHPTQTPVVSRAERLGIKPPTPFVVPDREPGDDTDSEAEDRKRKPQNGRVKPPEFSLRAVVELIAQLRRELDKLAHEAGQERQGANGLVLTPEQAGIVRRLQEVATTIQGIDSDITKWKKTLQKQSKE